jgi:hypothetical protein
MASVSAYLVKQTLDWMLGGATGTQPANRWAGLAAGTPTSVSGSELAAAQGYFSRLTALFGAAASPTGSASNTAAMTFGPFSSGGSALGIHLWDGSPIASSNMLWYGTLQTARTYGIGDSLVLAAGALAITLG